MLAWIFNALHLPAHFLIGVLFLCSFLSTFAVDGASILYIHSRAVRISFHHFSNISYRYSFHIFLCCFNWLMDMLLCIFDFQTTFFPIYFLFLAFLSERLKSTNFNNERMKMTAMSRIFFFGITSSLQAVQLFDRF